MSFKKSNGRHFIVVSLTINSNGSESEIAKFTLLNEFK